MFRSHQLFKALRPQCIRSESQAGGVHARWRARACVRGAWVYASVRWGANVYVCACVDFPSYMLHGRMCKC